MEEDDGFLHRLAHSWDVFRNKADPPAVWQEGGQYLNMRPDRQRYSAVNDKSIIGSVYNRIAIDVAAVALNHVKVDEDGRFVENVDSWLNYCLTQEANIDQAARAFRQDLAMTLFDKGVIAITPIVTTLNPNVTGAYDVKDMRVGEVVQWFPQHVKVSVYNDVKGIREEVVMPKKVVSVIENPLYTVMNEPNGTLKRLVHKLSLLDAVDDASSSGKLDLIVQLPYVVKSEARRLEAEKRSANIEMQLKGSKYGIAYIDGTERITQLNRPAENNLMGQVEYLTNMLYSQLGLTEEVFNGTADEKTMINYYNRTIEPILTAIQEGIQRTFLTKTARTQGHAIRFYRDPFKLVTLEAIAELADKLTRNEVASSNEIRGVMGWRPSKDPAADQLRNSNIPQASENPEPTELEKPERKELQNGS